MFYMNLCSIDGTPVISTESEVVSVALVGADMDLAERIQHAYNNHNALCELLRA